MWASGGRMTRTLFRPGSLVAATSLMFPIMAVTSCEETNNSQTKKKKPQLLLRKQTTLHQAASGQPSPQTRRRFNTKEELSKIRLSEKDMLLRWEQDEDGWRELPARAWPAYQPNAEQLEGIREQMAKLKCNITSQSMTTSTASATITIKDAAICNELMFNMATALVFYNLDPELGLRHYRELAKQGHVDSMVACGIVLIEGMGVPPQENEGVDWLKQAVAQGSAQGCYELGTILYTGIVSNDDGDDECMILEEDEEAAFELFEKAAILNHTAGMYMTADCLVGGEGTEKSVGRAIPLFYKAAERGHRFSRQRIRELLSQKE